MSKATGNARKVDGKTTKGNTASRKLTFGGCKCCTRELSKPLYKRHAKFRELDKANNGNVDARDLVLSRHVSGWRRAQHPSQWRAASQALFTPLGSVQLN